jgi:hypothetical protein
VVPASFHFEVLRGHVHIEDRPAVASSPPAHRSSSSRFAFAGFPGRDPVPSARKARCRGRPSLG